MISTSTMIRLGKVKGNKMVDMQLTNHKLEERGARMVMEELKITLAKAKALLLKHGNVRKAIQAYFEEPPGRLASKSKVAPKKQIKKKKIKEVKAVAAPKKLSNPKKKISPKQKTTKSKSTK